MAKINYDTPEYVAGLVDGLKEGFEKGEREGRREASKEKAELAAVAMQAITAASKDPGQVQALRSFDQLNGLIDGKPAAPGVVVQGNVQSFGVLVAR